MTTVIPIDTPGLGDRTYLAHDGKVALVVDPQRDYRPGAGRGRARRVCGSRTWWRPTSTTTTSPAAWRWPGGGRGLPGQRRRPGRLRAHRCPTATWSRWATRCVSASCHPRPHPHPPLVRPRGRGPRRWPCSPAGSLLFGSTGRPDLLGPDHTDTLVRAQHASAHRLADELPDGDRGLPDARVRQLLLGHPVRGRRPAPSVRRSQQPGADPGRAGVRRRAARRASTTSPPTTPTWARPTPPARARPTCPPPSRRRGRASPPHRRRRVGRGPAHPDGVRRRRTWPAA